MFGDNDELFRIFPDVDLDGDHDLVDALLFDNILSEEETEAESLSELDLDDELAEPT